MALCAAEKQKWTCVHPGDLIPFYYGFNLFQVLQLSCAEVCYKVTKDQFYSTIDWVKAFGFLRCCKFKKS